MVFNTRSNSLRVHMRVCPALFLDCEHSMYTLSVMGNVYAEDSSHSNGWFALVQNTSAERLDTVCTYITRHSTHYNTPVPMNTHSWSNGVIFKSHYLLYGCILYINAA